MHSTRLLRAALALHALVLLASGQTATDLRNRPQIESNLPIEAVGPDDLLALSVADCADLTKTFRVSKDGRLTLPLLKQPLSVSGLTPPAIASAVAHELTEEQIFIQPVVSVQVIEYRSHMVTVAGAVKRPGQVQVAGRMTLLDVLSAAEGVSPEAGAVVILTGANSQTRQTIPLKKLFESPTLENNPVLTGGEEVRVPEAAKVYVMGNVKKPGAFPLHDGQNTTVLKIMAECEGTLPYSRAIAYIYRQDENGQRTEIPVQLNALLTRKSPDVPLYGSDVLYVLDNNGKRVGVGVLDRILQFGSNARMMVP
ncbi:MAG: polysaccharide export protein [Acidobacteriota bacterium]|nr:polysaccharide export protein [Acidobacteriota bacterium]MDQ2841331.1 polysaccharide export protein [Acidobacteriota bacterium]